MLTLLEQDTSLLQASVSHLKNRNMGANVLYDPLAALQFHSFKQTVIECMIHVVRRIRMVFVLAAEIAELLREEGTE